jgi:tight adherence protein C
MELIIAMAAAFLSAALVVFVIFGAVAALVTKNETLWLTIKAQEGSLPVSSYKFAQRIFLKLVENLTWVATLSKKSAKDLKRAGMDVSADTFVAQLVSQGLLITIVLGLIFMAFGSLMGMFIAAFLGLFWVFYIQPSNLATKAEKRSHSIYKRIPYALDLSILVLETGGTLRQALEEIATKNDALAEEFRVALAEIDSGASQKVAFQNMGERVGLEPLTTILLAINRGQEMGAPMVATLETQAEAFREARLQQIEKLAVEAPTKMTFPNMMIMFAVLLLIVGPLMVQLLSSGVF